MDVLGHGFRTGGFRPTWPNSWVGGSAGVGSPDGSWRKSVVIGADTRPVVGCLLAFLVLASGCGDSPSPTVPTPTQVAGNSAPSASGAIPEQALTVDGAAAGMDVAPYFVDLDGDTLTYAAVSSDAAVASASVSGSTVMLTPVSLGTVIATVTATDPGGLTATQPITVTVGQDDVTGPETTQTRPDLVVSPPSVSDSRPAAGAIFALSATVRNDGDGDAAATTVRYYRSSDSTITTSDTQVGTHAVGTLAASGSGSQSVDLNAPSLAGRYYYGACVDAVAGESDTANNCSASVQVDVPERSPLSKPDLVVASPTVSDDGPTAGASFTLSATVRNDGDGDAAATTLRYYRSSDSTITTSDAQVGTETVAGLAASGRASASADLTAPSNPGTYYYGACVDDVAGEVDTTNNCSTSILVTVRESPRPQDGNPDLVLASPSVSDRRPTAGASFTLSATARNDGDGDAAATTLRYYRSSDSTITTSDTQVSTDAVGTLAASGSSSESVNLTAPSSAGSYYYGACVDAVAGESDTTNNCSSSVQVDVREPPPPSHPDLVLASPTVSESGPAAGASFTLSTTVRNEGDGTLRRRRCATTGRRTRRSRRPIRRWVRMRSGRLSLRGAAANRWT